MLSLLFVVQFPACVMSRMTIDETFSPFSLFLHVCLLFLDSLIVLFFFFSHIISHTCRVDCTRFRQFPLTLVMLVMTSSFSSHDDDSSMSFFVFLTLFLLFFRTTLECSNESQTFVHKSNRE